MCGEGLEGPWSALVDAEPRGGLLVGPWQYQSWDRLGMYPVYYPPGTQPVHHPGYYPPTRTMVCTACYGPRHPGTCTYDRFRLPEGDPRGR